MKGFKTMNEHFGSQLEAGERLGFATGGTVKSDEGSPNPGYSKGGKVNELRAKIKDIEKRRATTVGHNRRRRMNEQIAQFEDQLRELLGSQYTEREAQTLKKSAQKKACGGRMKKGGFNRKPVVGK